MLATAVVPESSQGALLNEAKRRLRPAGVPKYDRPPELGQTPIPASATEADPMTVAAVVLLLLFRVLVPRLLASQQRTGGTHCLYWLFVSHFFLCPEEYLVDSFMKQEPRRTVSPTDKFSSHFSVGSPSSLGKSNFLPKWLANSIRSLFGAHLPLEVISAARSRRVSLS